MKAISLKVLRPHVQLKFTRHIFKLSSVQNGPSGLVLCNLQLFQSFPHPHLILVALFLEVPHSFTGRSKLVHLFDRPN
jgi:hypothetical protein